MDHPLGQRWPATKRREQPPRLQVSPQQPQQLLRAAQAVPLQHDRVDPAGPEPAPHHASQQAARIQLVIADDVRNHITHPPLRAQRRRLPLPRRQSSEKRREIRPLVPRQAPHVHRKQANARSHTQARVRPRTTPMPSADITGLTGRPRLGDDLPGALVSRDMPVRLGDPEMQLWVAVPSRTCHQPLELERYG